MTLLQHANLSRVEAIEAANLLDPRRINGRCRRRLLRRGLVDPPCPFSSRTHSPAPPWVIFDKVNQLVAVVKYHLKRSAAPPGRSDLAPLPSPEPEHDRAHDRECGERDGDRQEHAVRAHVQRLGEDVRERNLEYPE